MKEIITELTHYGTILLIITYVVLAMLVMRKKSIVKGRNKADVKLANEKTENLYAYIMFAGVILLQILFALNSFIMTLDIKIFTFYGIQLAYVAIVFVVFKIMYKKGSIVLLSHMCMLLTIGLTIIARVSFTKAVRQLELIIFATVLSGLIPFIMSKFKMLRKMAWFYGSIGIGLLVIVLLIGENTYGAKLSIEIFDVAFQPSEFVKIVFVFFVAAMFEHGAGFKQVVKTSIMAAAHVLILVASRDLGSALIYAIVYVVLVFTATGNPLYLLGGFVGGAGASVVAYELFDHVKTRVIAWLDPWSVIEDKGYQVSQSLFSIGTGGFQGLGLYKGSPQTVPLVEEDFVFSAVVEELGGIFGICIIIIVFLCIYIMFKAAWESYGSFYKYMALGLGAIYGIQVFITIGGAIKLIPSTGVTLPLISYGGSSILGTIAMFSIIQGIIILRHDEDDRIEKERLEKSKARKEKSDKAKKKAGK